MKFILKGGTLTYDLIDLVVLCGIDFENREKAEVLGALGDSFEYDLALQIKRYELPDNFIKIPQNTILTENNGYYIKINYKEGKPKSSNGRGVLYYIDGHLVESLPDTEKLLVPEWGITPISSEDGEIHGGDNDRINRLLKKINVLKFNVCSYEYFTACVWGNNAVVQDRDRCYVCSLRNSKKIQELDGVSLYGVLNNKPILVSNLTEQIALLELDKYLSLIKF